MQYFDHEKLDVYRAAIELVVLIDDIVEQLPRGRSYLADQLQRAGTSVPLNIAEGAGEYSSNEKVIPFIKNNLQFMNVDRPECKAPEGPARCRQPLVGCRSRATQQLGMINI